MTAVRLTICRNERCFVVLHANAHRCFHCGDFIPRGVAAEQRREEKQAHATRVAGELSDLEVARTQQGMQR